MLCVFAMSLHPLRTHPRRAALVAALLLALAFTQTLGALHRVAHGSGAAATATSQQWLQALFGGHDHGGGTCDLYDQGTHGDALSVQVDPMVAAFEPPPLRDPHRAWHLAAQSAGFLARGPPFRS